MQETWVRSLGQEDPLEEDMATRSGILAWRIPWTEEPGGLTVHGVAKSQTWLSDGAPTVYKILFVAHLFTLCVPQWIYKLWRTRTMCVLWAPPSACLEQHGVCLGSQHWMNRWRLIAVLLCTPRPSPHLAGGKLNTELFYVPLGPLPAFSTLSASWEVGLEGLPHHRRCSLML